MDSLIAIDVAILLIILYVLDRNLFRYVDLLLQSIRTRVSLLFYERVLRIRLWFDRQAVFHRGPVGRLWNEYTLWRIRNNPAYKEFFQPRD